MSQGSTIIAAILALFFLFVTARGELPKYKAILF